MRQGWSFSGHERHCVFLNTGAVRFANVSGVSGLDFPDDGRGLSRVDWDHDGDLDLWTANRSAPQVRFLRNEVPSDNHYLALRLEGHRCNRDAIGTRVEVVITNPHDQNADSTTNNLSPILVKTLRAGEGFLSQSTKWLHFGLGKATRVERVIVHWPGGKAETLTNLEIDRHYKITQGDGRAITWSPPLHSLTLQPSPLQLPQPDFAVKLFLSAPISLPRLEFRPFSGDPSYLARNPGQPLLLNLWASWCLPCLQELAEFTHRQHDIRESGISVIALSVDNLSSEHGGNPDGARQLIDGLGFPFDSGLAEPGLVDKLQLINNLILDDYRNFPVPTSFLIDANGRLAAIYKGAVKVDEVLFDVQQLTLTGAARHEATQPFTGRKVTGIRVHRLLMIPARLREQGFVDDAIDYIKQNHAALADDSLYAGLLADIARDLFEAKRFHHAVTWYRNAIDARPKFKEAYLGLGRSFDATQRYDEAANTLRKALELDPEMGDAHLQLALTLQKQGDGDGALQHFRQATRLLPNYAPGYLALGTLLGARSQFDAAVANLQKATELDPTVADAHMKLGLIWVRTGKTTEGVAAFRRGLELNPTDAKAHHRLGVILESTGQRQDAILQYRKALQINPQQSDAHLHLAMLLEQTGDTMGAAVHYRHRLNSVPGDTRALNNLAWILATDENPQIRDGRTALELALKAAQDTDYQQPSVLSTLAAAYAANGQLVEAISQVSTAITLARTAGQENVLASLQEQLESYQQDKPSSQN